MRCSSLTMHGVPDEVMIRNLMSDRRGRVLQAAPRRQKEILSMLVALTVEAYGQAFVVSGRADNQKLDWADDMLYLDPGRSSQLHPDHRPGRAGCTCTGTRWRRRAISCPGCIIDDFDHDDQLAVAVAAAARGRRTPAASLYVAPHSEGPVAKPVQKMT